ncbi:unnamed protein product, partial [Polarella glacialis]
RSLLLRIEERSSAHLLLGMPAAFCSMAGSTGRRLSGGRLGNCRTFNASTSGLPVVLLRLLRFLWGQNCRASGIGMQLRLVRSRDCEHGRPCNRLCRSERGISEPADSVCNNGSCSWCRVGLQGVLLVLHLQLLPYASGGVGRLGCRPGPHWALLK